MDFTEDNAIGDLVSTIIDGVNEYQSRASGADIAYKMGQEGRARRNGRPRTIGLSQRLREVRRSPEIRMAGHRYPSAPRSS